MMEADLIERQDDRNEVLTAVHLSIQEGMDPGSVGHYASLARKYAKKYGIESIVEDWLLEGRKVFYPVETARDWAETLP